MRGEKNSVIQALFKKAQQVSIPKTPASHASGSDFNEGIKGSQVDDMRGGAAFSKERVFAKRVTTWIAGSTQGILFFGKTRATSFDYTLDIAALVGV
ncbi:MAG: hypothetical protein ACE5Z5_11615 [Candidatus Bathyarchaeia archaeon]